MCQGSIDRLHEPVEMEQGKINQNLKESDQIRDLGFFSALLCALVVVG